MFAVTTLSEFQVVTLCVIGTILVVYPLVAILVGILGVVQRKA